MSDATSLRTLLTRVDATAPGIQSCAAAMMKHYDRSSGVAVVEWRNALHNSQREQWIPLIYVANEVLQNSKRNRGNKFLEAFSPILGQSLIFVCQHSEANIVEKIRRTVKIWGDRRVFSVRYVNELLKGLEPYRNNDRGASAAPIVPPPPSSQSPGHPTTTSPSPATTTPSPHHQNQTTNHPANKQQQQDATKPVVEESSSHNEDDDDEEEDPMDLLNDDNDEDDDDDDDDSNVFGDSDSVKLDVQVNLDSTALTSPGVNGQRNKHKRRRSSTASSGSHASASKRSRRRSVLSTTSLVELWKRVAALEQSYDHAVAMVHDIHQLPEPEQLESLVGGELLDHHKMICKYQERITQQRANLHSIANERRAMEQQAVRYIPWLEAALQQDGDDLEFCRKLEESLLKFQHIHPAIRDARDKRVAEDLKYQREQAEKERKRKEEEERKKFREQALSKETEAKPGMVWNKVTQEYQYLNTDESWRD